jgi:superfamily II DNA or RNA helicase
MIELSYNKGTILIKGSIRVPYATWDMRVNCYRAQALYYREIVEYLKRSKLEYKDRVLELIPCQDLILSTQFQLRDYQERALNAWLSAGKKGTIALPTGAGKTHIAIKAISIVNQPTIVVVPTLDLLEQWRVIINRELSIEAGTYGGGKHILKAVTIATYDTAYIRAEELGNKFMLIIFDEVHHLPASGYMQIAELSAAPYRLGLTATYEREDGLHLELDRLIGGKVFEADIQQLAGRYLAEYEVKTIRTELTPAEKKAYTEAYEIFLNYLRVSKIALKTPSDFQSLIMRTGRDSRAREALLARHRARQIALNSASKLNALKQILENHHSDRILIFTEHNELVHKISKEFLIPAITHRTSKNERMEILENFKNARYKAIVTSKVLDEGIDVPEANIGIIVSGSGSTREFKQRLGRLLRKREGKKAILYEIVSMQTSEVGTSKRRKKKVLYASN